MTGSFQIPELFDALILVIISMYSYTDDFLAEGA